MSVAQTGLLLRLQQNGDPAAWDRLVDLYSPLLFLWACRAGLPGTEAAEFVRLVFSAVAQKLHEFRIGSPGGFRGWLHALAHSQRRELLRKQKLRAGPPALPTITEKSVPPVSAEAEALWEGEYLPFLLKASVEILQTTFPPMDWKAFWGLTIEGRSAAEVAREVNGTVPAVYAAEARMLRALRQELDGLLD